MMKKKKNNNLTDSVFLWIDTILEHFKLVVNKQVSSLQCWLFVKNQKAHDVNVREFCKKKEEKEDTQHG